MDIQKYLSGMLNYNPNIDWVEEQKFDANGMPIPMHFGNNLVGEPVAKSMPVRMRDEDVHAAADIAKAVYICTESKIYKSTEQVTLISSRICSKIKQDK